MHIGIISQGHEREMMHERCGMDVGRDLEMNPQDKDEEKIAVRL